jgi:hypothetical protein
MKIFSLEEAQRTLPLMTEIARDILACHAAIDDAADAVRKESRRFSRFKLEGLEASKVHSQEIGARRARARLRLSELATELQSLGATLLLSEQAVIGFPSFLDSNELVHLLWSPGEQDISTYCYGADARSRHALPLSQLSDSGQTIHH